MKESKTRPAFHVDDELREAAKRAADIFKREEREYRESVIEDFLNGRINHISV